jgi:hypothetical protein
MTWLDRTVLLILAGAVVLTGWLVSRRDLVVNVESPKPVAPVEITLPPGFTDALAESYCAGNGGSWTVKGACVYGYGE